MSEVKLNNMLVAGGKVDCGEDLCHSSTHQQHCIQPNSFPRHGHRCYHAAAILVCNGLLPRLLCSRDRLNASDDAKRHHTQRSQGEAMVLVE